MVLSSIGLEIIVKTYDSNNIESMIRDMLEINIIVLDDVHDPVYLKYCNEFKSNEKIKHIPIIAICDKNILQDQAIKSGVDGYIQSPVDITEFQKTLKNCLR